jgi:O-antigen ligase
MAIVLILAATMEGNWRRWALAGGVLVLCGAGLYFSYSRTAWLGLIAVFGLYTATNRPTQSLRAIAVCGLALGFGVLLATLLNVSIVEIMQRRMAELSESQFSMRLLVWPTAWAMFRTHPLFGVGLGSFATAFADDFPPIHWAWSPDHAHNVFLQIACQHGVIGLALFMILAGRAFFAYRAARNLRDPAARSAAKGLLYAFIALLAMGLSDHQYFDVRLGLLFFGVPAILYAAGGIGKQSEYALSPHR